MQLLGLKTLHSGMVSRGFTRTQFKCNVSDKQIQVVFIAEGAPYILGIIVGNVVISIPVLAGYTVNPVLPYQDYSRLSKAMGKDHKNGETFYCGAFFKELDSCIPSDTAPGMFVAPWLALMLFPNVDEPNKHHFMGFVKNAADSPSSHNLEKTKFLIGEDAYKICKNHGISSRWSEDPSRSIKVVPEVAKLKATYSIKNSNLNGPSLKPIKKTTATQMGILCGAPGTGKSTLAREIQRENPHIIVLDLDVVTAPLVAQLLKQARVPLAEVSEHEILYSHIVNAQYAALSALAHDLLSQGHYPLCVGTFNQNLKNPTLFMELAENLEKMGVTLKLAVLTTQPEEAKRRLQERADHWDVLRLNDWNVLAQQYDSPTLPVGLHSCIVDTTDYSRPQVVAQLANFFK